MKTINIIVDTEKAYDIFDKLVHIYKLKKYPFNQPDVHVPQVPENMPKKLKRGGVEEAMFFHIDCYWMRGGIESDTATKSLSSVYDLYSDLFDPFVAKDISPLEIIPILESNGLGYGKKEAARFWVENANRISKVWDGNPLDIFEGAELLENPFDEILVPRIRNDGKGNGFLGFQEKMVAMKTYFYMDTGLIEPFITPLPVDFHVLRISLMHEIIGVMNGNGKNWYMPELLAEARKLTFNYSLDRGTSLMDLCDAVWLYARSMCKYDPRARSSIAKERNGRKTPTPEKEASWSDAQKRTFRNTCGSCVIFETCKYKIRSAVYYVNGRLIPEEKDSCPVPSLEGFSFRDIGYVAPAKVSIDKKSQEPLVKEDHPQLFTI